MNTILVLDASAIISSELSQIEYSKGYIPSSVAEELKCQKSTELISLHMCKIEIRDPTDLYVKKATEKSLEMGYSALSTQDIQLAALALELTTENNSIFSTWITETTLSAARVIAVSLDNALKSVMTQLGIELHDTFTDKNRKYLQRCYTCTKIYKTDEKIDFCKACGYSTISRVAYTEENGKLELFLSRNYKYSEKTLKTKYGKPIKSQDQKEYRWYKRNEQKDEQKSKEKIETLLCAQNWDCRK